MVPAGTDFDVDLISFENGVATLALAGDLVVSQLKHLKTALERLSGLGAVVLDIANLKSIDDSVLNYLVFSKQSYPETYTISLQGLPDHLKATLEESELLEEFILL